VWAPGQTRCPCPAGLQYRQTSRGGVVRVGHRTSPFRGRNPLPNVPTTAAPKHRKGSPVPADRSAPHKNLFSRAATSPGGLRSRRSVDPMRSR
jgi:hypothetical protein